MSFELLGLCMHVHPDTHRVYNRGSILDDLDLLLIFCGGVITVFQKLPALSCNLAISSRVWKHCCPSVWAGGKMWFIGPYTFCRRLDWGWQQGSFSCLDVCTVL